jgi:DNA polymerase I-like protein with 3'-5' exonuclease and polymerase domains
VIPLLTDIEVKDGDTVAVDLETYDPKLKTHGSGAIINKGFVCGIAIAYRDETFYFPIKHKGPNLASNLVWKVLNKKIFQNKKIDKVFHNAMYDVCWIRSVTGLMPQGNLYDTMIAASVIDENRKSYSLDSLSAHFLKDKKYKYDLQEKSLAEHGISDPMSNMDKLPYDLVKDYAEQDVSLTLRLWKKFKDIINKPIQVAGPEDNPIKYKTLQNIFDLETKLFPCLVEMRFKGVRVDKKRSEDLGNKLKRKQENIVKGIKRKTGVDVSIWAADSIKQLLDHQKITDYKITQKTKRPMLSKQYLESHPNKYLKLVARARQYDKLFNTFVHGILKFVHNGRIHAEINQIKSERGGTVTGRFSMSNPNLQQIPARTEQGNQIRSLFLPDEDCKWASFDYSQQEPRLVVHYALKSGFTDAEVIANKYHEDDNTDFHDIVAKMANITRKQAKTINLGLFYGMGKGKLARSLELEPDEAKDLFNQYHSDVPFVRGLAQGLQKYAEEEKHIYTLEDRFCRFDKWEPVNKEWDDVKGAFVFKEIVEKEGKNVIETIPVPIMERGEAMEHYLANRSRNSEESDPHCLNFESYYRPAFTYKALNRLIQGSAADMTKRAMVKLYEAGIVPHIQIHDELCFSIKTEEEANKIKEIMENAIQLKVPNKVDYESGPNWGNIK